MDGRDYYLPPWFESSASTPTSPETPLPTINERGDGDKYHEIEVDC